MVNAYLHSPVMLCKDTKARGASSSSESTQRKTTSLWPIRMTDVYSNISRWSSPRSSSAICHSAGEYLSRSFPEGVSIRSRRPCVSSECWSSRTCRYMRFSPMTNRSPSHNVAIGDSQPPPTSLRNVRNSSPSRLKTTIRSLDSSPTNISPDELTARLTAPKFAPPKVTDGG